MSQRKLTVKHINKMIKKIGISIVVALIINASLLGAKENDRKADSQLEEKAFVSKSKEKVLFFGVEVAPASPALVEQLELSPGVGLVVRYVVPESPADKVGVKEHDVLTHFDDQILITQRQLSVLVRNHKAENEVLFTLIRKGKGMKIKSLLEWKEISSHPRGYFRWMGRDGLSHPGVDFKWMGEEHFSKPAVDFDVILNGEIAPMVEGQVFNNRRYIKGFPDSIAITHDGNVNSGALGNVLFSDESMSIGMIKEGDAKVFTIRDVDGNKIFRGTTSDEKIEELDPEIRERLERMEKIQLPEEANMAMPVEGVKFASPVGFRETI